MPSQIADTLGSLHGFVKPSRVCFAVIEQIAVDTTLMDLVSSARKARYRSTVFVDAGNGIRLNSRAQSSKRLKAVSYFVQVLDAFELPINSFALLSRERMKSGIKKKAIAFSGSRIRLLHAKIATISKTELRSNLTAERKRNSSIDFE